MARYQIIKRLKGTGNKWEFVAHGAVYKDGEGDTLIAMIKSHGTHVVRKLSCT